MYLFLFFFLSQYCVSKGSGYFSFLCRVITSTKSSPQFLSGQRSLGKIIGLVFVEGELTGSQEICSISCVGQAVYRGEDKIKDI